MIKKNKIQCPLCDCFHNVEENIRMTTFVYNEKEITYKERFYFCPNVNEEFETGSIINENLLNMKKALKENNMHL